MFRLLIVDDEYYVRVGIKSAIDWSEIGVEVVGEAADGEEALEMALSSRPDIILTDVRMPFMDGLTLILQKRKHLRLELSRLAAAWSLPERFGIRETGISWIIRRR